EDQTVQRALTESTRIEDDLSKSWAMLGSQSEKEIESLKQEIKKLKSKIQLAQTKPQIKENRQLEGALKQELQLLKTKGMLEHIHQMRLLLHAFFPKVREAFGRAALHKIFCEKFNNSSMILDKEELQKLSQLSWEDYLGDGIENIVHIEAQLVEIFTKIQSVVSLKTNTMRQM
ncbi:MAG: hypothetical protein KDK50_06010, partial [Chlamydiia bacterium]|nr:hypothetical protein [Chlamydiia bacterium]